MFVPQRMKKLDVVIIKKYVDKVTKEILHFGDFEVMDISLSKLETYALKKDKFDEITSRLLEHKRKLNGIASFLNLDINHVSSEKEEFLDEFAIKNDIQEMDSEIKKYHREMEKLKKRQNDIQIKLNSVRFFGNLDMDLTQAKDIKHFYMGFGSVPSHNHQAFVESLSTIPSVVMNVGTLADQNMVFFTVPNNMRDQVDKILQNVYFKDYGVPQDMKGTIKSNIVKYGFELSMTYDEEIWLDEQYQFMVQKMGKKIGNISNSIDYHLSMARLKGEMASTNSVYLFSGWVPSDEVKNISDKIESITDEKCLFLDEDAADLIARDRVDPPTKLNNPKSLKPFEGLVTMFGTPNYREIDPTLPAAILYFIMFGAMFGDVGHGFVLSIIGLILLFIKKFSGIHMLAKIMFWVGLSSIGFGFLYGGLFGHEYHLIEALWMSPMDNIMTILIIAIGFGAAVISLGTIFNIINCYRLKDYGKMLFGSTGTAGLLFYWSLLALITMVVTQIKIPIWLISIPIIMATFIFFEKFISYHVFHHGEKEPLFMGFFEIFESVLSMMSNTISFLRVGAFALNHGALMAAVAILANMSSGPVGKWIIVFIGNIFVIVLEGMIVGIQSLRLEYYEFFIKFFKADGHQFEGLDIYKRK